jgi:predicted lipoprotein with Yx(FWY)xxD motif
MRSRSANSSATQATEGELMKIAIVLAALALPAVSVTAAQAATHPVARGATVGASVSALGRVLVDAKGETLYLFEKDARKHSACAGTCANYWPPLLTKGTPIARGAVKQSLLGVTRRGDGTKQVTYAGHPLYRFALDAKPGQTKGEGLDDFGAEWYAVAPAGTGIEKAPASPVSGGGY